MSTFTPPSFTPCVLTGAGGNTKKLHIPNLQKIDGVQVVSVANRSLESSQKAADAFGITKVCDSHALQYRLLACLCKTAAAVLTVVGSMPFTP